jgi:hypothetical protein
MPEIVYHELAVSGLQEARDLRGQTFVFSLRKIRIQHEDEFSL